MTKVRVTKEFDFEAAHVLDGHDGKCKNIHGHSYHLEVTIIGEPMHEPGHPKNGMVIDFAQLKTIIKSTIVDPIDHALILPTSWEQGKKLTDQNIVWVSYQPTCENMVADYAIKLQEKLPAGIKLYSMMLRETASSHAEWFASDNE